MTVAYLIQSHHRVDLLYRLVRTLRAGSPDAVIHVSHDRRCEPVDPAELTSAGVTAWSLDLGGYGDWTHVQRHLDAVRHLRDHEQPVDWVVSLTGQDYPLRPVRAIEADLAASTGDGYLECFDVLGPDCPWPRHRTESRYLFEHRHLLALTPGLARALRPVMLVNRVQPWVRVHTAYGLTVGLRSAAAQAAGLTRYGGSAFMTLRWRAALELLRLGSDPELVRLFRRALSPEESFAQTVLRNHTDLDLVDDPRRFWDFTVTRANHPRTLGLGDVERALASGADFGRKFDDHAVLDRLDAALAQADVVPVPRPHPDPGTVPGPVPSRS